MCRRSGPEFETTDHTVPVALSMVGHTMTEWADVHCVEPVVNAQGEYMPAWGQYAKVELVGSAERIGCAILPAVNPYGAVPVDALEMKQGVHSLPACWNIDVTLEPGRSEVVPRRLEKEGDFEVAWFLPLLEHFRVTPAVTSPFRLHRRYFTETLGGDHARKLNDVGELPRLRPSLQAEILRIEGETPFTSQREGRLFAPGDCRRRQEEIERQKRGAKRAAFEEATEPRIDGDATENSDRTHDVYD